ncbi:phosphoglucomutase, alpha-D-glucose phosphate-specific [Candidatus Providencia siddallii]|uniref:Phosphoglucomutase n=1 Tax=Candidatus Providencia siddallii TaxID=1715285 RepID=A0ABP1CG42_9GAMM
MIIHKNAGNIPTQNDLINIAQLIAKYYTEKPNPKNKTQIIKFGTSGHRGISLNKNFNENHIISIAQSIVNLRKKYGITGPCYIGKDTHALSEAAFISIIEVFVANKIKIIIQKINGFTPTPVISNMILKHNENNLDISDGIIITASHNPPEYGGIKYNYKNGGPANIYLTSIIENNANKFLINNLNGIKRLNFKKSLKNKYIIEKDFVLPYVSSLNKVIDIKSIFESKLKMAVDPLGGSGIEYWKYISKYYQLNIEILNDQIDQTFRFIPLDYDGVIRMDCSSYWTMNKLLKKRNKFDLLFANDPDHDRHAIITPEGLMNPNHYLTVAINYLFHHRPLWNKNISVGKTIVSSSMIDYIVKNINRKLIEVSVGFKWFVNGLFCGKIGFAGEESAGASFLRIDGKPWSTDKDGIILCLLAAEITAVTGKSPQQHYNELSKKFGSPIYKRTQIKINNTKLIKLKKFFLKSSLINKFAGDKIIKYFKIPPSNKTSIGGFKIITNHSWIAIRQSETDETFKIYFESFNGKEHLNIMEEEFINLIKDNIN